MKKKIKASLHYFEGRQRKGHDYSLADAAMLKNGNYFIGYDPDYPNRELYFGPIDGKNVQATFSDTFSSGVVIVHRLVTIHRRNKPKRTKKD